MIQIFRGAILALSLLVFFTTEAEGHRVLLQGGDRLAIASPNGEIEWEMPWGAIHDIHTLENGHIMVQRGMQEIVEIDPKTKTVVWSYNAQESNGNVGKKLEVHSFQLLSDGGIMIAESGPARIIEIDRDGTLRKEIKLKVNNPHPHMDTRLVRKLSNDHYLVCHEGDGFVREYDSAGDVVWEYEVPLYGKERKGGHGPDSWGNKTFAALRLSNGNTLISTGNGHGVLEVTPQKKVVWKLGQKELPGITFAWVTTLEVLSNGNYVIGNCHAGPGQPILVEIEPTSKKVVWRFDCYDTFGNNVSNSVLLEPSAKRLQ
ncbi:MAG: PQQ-like beta-propeller repeat protein [Candidatus Hydrogenedentes bacterium]|nr:PQQ-like beta-propeller repeat protein [Candidatus Hydrogenedentota bacterium]